jgi:hypothetical protein
METNDIPEDDRDDAAAPAAELPTPAPPAPSGDNKWTRLGVGVPITFVVMSLLYGPNQVVQMIFFATVCTLGIGLILMLLCWVCYVVLASAVDQVGTAPMAS